MSGRLSSSPQKQLFIEYLAVNGREHHATRLIHGIDSICDFIAGRYSGADRSNAFDRLQRFAVDAHTREQFLELIEPALRNFGNNERSACELFFCFADTKSIEESFASYMVGRYRLGYPYLALYWAAILFERIISKKWRSQDKEWYRKTFDPNREITLKEKIERLKDATLQKDSIYLNTDIFQDYIFKNPGGKTETVMMSPHLDEQRLRDTRMRLTNFRILRNGIMHDLSRDTTEEKTNNHLEFVTYVWLELIPKSFDQQLAKNDGLPPREKIFSLYETTADYMIRAVDETTKKEPETTSLSAIRSEDFENLYRLRDRLLPLRQHLQAWLDDNRTGLTTDIITPIDTTSAYIWMPLVARDKKVGKKAGIYNGAVSILATPLDFRVYLDFGGYAQPDRFAYYQFLESDDYLRFLEVSRDMDGMIVFDIDWFSFICDRIPVDKWHTERAARIEAAKRKLLTAQLPITWNRMLHGYIFEKAQLPDEGIDFPQIEKYLARIIEFYQVFTGFNAPLDFDEYRKQRERK